MHVEMETVDCGCGGIRKANFEGFVAECGTFLVAKFRRTPVCLPSHRYSLAIGLLGFRL